ncbi:MAG: hypothetical protein PHY54_05555 [Methylococcales bacterium]|nr:hypothetical protein [Methylococcales bacterium]
MAEEKNKENNGLTSALPATVALAILAGLIFTHSLPYQDERPSTRPLLIRYPAAQDVDARLWQDPFAAVDDINEETPAENIFIVANQNEKTQRIDATRQVANPSSHTLSQIYKDKKITSEDKILILAVTLSGGPYQEDGEQRMRRRYAVLSALANQDAVPEDEQHIGYFHPDPEPTMVLQHKIPFEWWSLPADNRKVLLLWLNESSLLENPAAEIKELLRQASQDKVPTGTEFNYAVIGPNTSTQLRDILKEVEDNKTSDSVAQCTGKPVANAAKSALGTINGQDIVYFSAGATASDWRLLQNIMPTECKTISDYMKSQGIALYRTTATDAAMMEVLVDELDARRVNKTDHVVILSEWDTFYGQVMPDAFMNAWSNYYKIPGKNVESIHFYGYMRGLDGKLPAQGNNTGNTSENTAAGEDKSGAKALIEFPEGQSQKDYLRRLTGKILELDQHLKDASDWNERPKGIAAFGVLGSDVHDKLLILEALRPYFPHKLFFTTDLDANFIHPARWHQTHNLLVASAFDLELLQELQDKIPPFRDSYQTAFFLAAQMAIKMAIEDGKSIASHIGIPQPRLFEIGRSRQVPLPMFKDKVLTARTNDGNEPGCSWTYWQACNTVQPRIFATSQLQWTAAGALILVIVATLPPLLSWRVRERMASSFKFCKSHPYALIGIGIALILPAYWLAPLSRWNHYITQYNAEPFYWVEGVSAWPSQLLRFSAVLYAAGFFLWGHNRILKMQNNLQTQGDETQRTFSLPTDPTRISRCGVLFIGSWKPEVNNEEMVFPDVLWRKYLGYCRQKKLGLPGSWLRVFVHGFAFFTVAFLLIIQSGFPSVPTRGVFAFIMNKYILFLAVPATILLTMWVVENARLCERLIEQLAEKPSQWNGIARDWAIRNKVAPECVSDWLDIQLVARLTETIQPLIWGPVGCIGLLVVARSPAIDDWGIPWGLGIVLIAMLLYAISAEVFLQRGAKRTRAKAIVLLSGKIRAQRNLNSPDEAAIIRIEAEIERIMKLRDGAFRPWYEWPLLQSFGSLGTLVFVLQYFEGVWENGVF